MTPDTATLVERAQWASDMVVDVIANNHVIVRQMRKHDPLARPDDAWFYGTERHYLDTCLVPLSVYMDVRSRDLADRSQWERLVAPLAEFEAQLGVAPLDLDSTLGDLREEAIRDRDW